MSLNAENHCAAAVLSVFEKLKFSSKKVLTNRGNGAIIINVVGRATQTLTTATILENDTEKSHFVQERRYGSAERCDDRINSQILNE